MNYQKIYNQLIEKRKQNILTKIRVNTKAELYDGIYTETHHIIPKCMNGSNDSSNLVELTAREHFVAHKLLFKMYIGTQFEAPLTTAFWQMCYCNKDKAYKINKSSRTFELEKINAQIIISKNLKGRVCINNGQHNKYVKHEQLQDYLNLGYTYGSAHPPWNKGRRDLPPSAIAGKHHTPETRAKISKKCKGLKLPVSAVEKLRKRMIGNKYSAGKHPSEKTLKLRSKKLSNRIRINNGIKMKYVLPEQLQTFLDNGWKIGMLPISNETKRKLSLANKGNVPANKGKKLSAETRLKMSLSKRGKPPNNKGKRYKIKKC